MYVCVFKAVRWWLIEHLCMYLRVCNTDTWLVTFFTTTEDSFRYAYIGNEVRVLSAGVCDEADLLFSCCHDVQLQLMAECRLC